MKLQKITFILSLLGILIIIFLSQNKPYQTGEIELIQTSKNIITIQLKNSTTKLIIFDNINLNLKENDRIKFIGKYETFRDQEQITIEKISKI